MQKFMFKLQNRKRVTLLVLRETHSNNKLWQLPSNINEWQLPCKNVWGNHKKKKVQIVITIKLYIIIQNIFSL
jgi:hypothetical protein